MSYKFYNDYYGYYQIDNTIFDSISGGRLGGVRHFVANNSFIYKEGYCSLGFAIKHGKTKIIKFLISEYCEMAIPIPKPDKNPLSLAVQRKDKITIKMLLENEAKLNYLFYQDSSGYIPLNYVGDSNEEITKILITSCLKLRRIPKPNRNPLSIAVKDQDTKLIKLFLEHESKFNYLNYCDSSGYSPLACAVETGNQEIIQILIDEGADCNKYGKNGKSLLSVAVDKENNELINLLLDNGAEFSVQSAFRIAIEKENIEIVKLLKGKGADVNFTYNNGCIPLFRAVETGNTALVKYLIENGATIAYNLDGDESAKVKLFSKGHTVLTKAVEMDNFKMIKLLIEAGTSVNTPNENKEYPLAIAISNCSFNIIKYLIESGADTDLVEAKVKELSSWNDDFTAFLKSRKSGQSIFTESGQEEADS